MEINTPSVVDSLISYGRLPEKEYAPADGKSRYIFRRVIDENNQETIKLTTIGELGLWDRIKRWFGHGDFRLRTISEVIHKALSVDKKHLQAILDESEKVNSVMCGLMRFNEKVEHYGQKRSAGCIARLFRRAVIKPVSTQERGALINFAKTPPEELQGLIKQIKKLTEGGRDLTSGEVTALVQEAKGVTIPWELMTFELLQSLINENVKKKPATKAVTESTEEKKLTVKEKEQLQELLTKAKKMPSIDGASLFGITNPCCLCYRNGLIKAFAASPAFRDVVKTTDMGKLFIALCEGLEETPRAIKTRDETLSEFNEKLEQELPYVSFDLSPAFRDVVKTTDMGKLFIALCEALEGAARALTKRVEAISEFNGKLHEDFPDLSFELSPEFGEQIKDTDMEEPFLALCKSLEETAKAIEKRDETLSGFNKKIKEEVLSLKFDLSSDFRDEIKNTDMGKLFIALCEASEETARAITKKEEALSSFNKELIKGFPGLADEGTQRDVQELMHPFLEKTLEPSPCFQIKDVRKRAPESWRYQMWREWHDIPKDFPVPSIDKTTQVDSVNNIFAKIPTDEEPPFSLQRVFTGYKNQDKPDVNNIINSEKVKNDPELQAQLIGCLIPAADERANLPPIDIVENYQLEGTPPRCLPIYVPRFTEEMGKNTARVKAPLFLTVSVGDTTKKSYVLRSVAVHHGTSRNSGHYLSYIPNLEEVDLDTGMPMMWTQHSDSSVSSCFWDDIKDDIETQGCIFVYDEVSE